MGLGSYFDRVEIENSHVRRLAYLLARIPGISVRETVGYEQISSSRCDAGATRVKSVLWVDGLKTESTYTGRFMVLSEYLPEQVWAVEVYRGRGSVPSQFDDPQACLTILLWTNSR
jgi:outer membrane cobalamin receptor